MEVRDEEGAVGVVPGVGEPFESAKVVAERE
jgi:hypothetical protein